MENRKFKAGDRVRNIEPDSLNDLTWYFKFGDCGTVVGYGEDDRWWSVLWDHSNEECSQYENWLEFAKEDAGGGMESCSVLIDEREVALRYALGVVSNERGVDNFDSIISDGFHFAYRFGEYCRKFGK